MMRKLYFLMGGRFPRIRRDWLDSIHSQRSHELDEIAAQQALTSEPKEKKNILFYSMIPWHQGCVEHILSTALRLRGHDVASVICGGMLPDCEMHYYDHDRPPCSVCLKSAQRYTDSFGIQPLLSTDFIGEGDGEEAEEWASGLSDHELTALRYHGVPVGEIARFQVNIFYQTFLTALDASQTEELRTFCKAGLLLAKFSERLLDQTGPDIVIVSNGKAFTYRPLFLLARQRNIQVVTWDEHAFDNQLKFVFNHNCYAGEIHLQEVWEAEKDRGLSDVQAKEIEDYFASWQRAEITPFPYYKNTKSLTENLYRSLNLRQGAPIVACFPNMVRDTSAFERDIAFESLMDWLHQTVEFARSRTDLEFVIRAHPAEKCLPEELAKYNRFFVCEELRRRFTRLPENVHLLEGDSPISSYAIVEESAVVIVYTSTIGLECALQGKLACVVGAVHYRDKGFTKDLTSPSELWRFLDEGPPYPNRITSAQVDLAKRYAYLWRFRHPITMPFFDPETLSFKLPHFGVLARGGNAVVEHLCRCIVEGSPFIDIPA